VARGIQINQIETHLGPNFTYKCDSFALVSRSRKTSTNFFLARYPWLAAPSVFSKQQAGSQSITSSLAHFHLQIIVALFTAS